MNNYLTDKEFLKKLDNTKEKRTYIRIISLDNKNNPLEMLEGRATGGSVNLDGASAVRRSCSLSLIAFEDKKFAEGQIIPITDVYWGLKNRFKLEVGIENLIEPKYPNIIWFKQGHFVINNFSKSININGGININISGQDKMAMLNGTLGGQFLSEIDFGTEEEIDEWGNVIIHKVPIYNIIKNVLQVYAQEPLENIIINDLDEENAWELWDYKGEHPMYMLGTVDQNKLKMENMVLDQDMVVVNTENLTNDEKIQGCKYYYKTYGTIGTTTDGQYLLREGSRSSNGIQTTGMKVDWKDQTIEHNFSFDYVDSDGNNIDYLVEVNGAITKFQMYYWESANQFDISEAEYIRLNLGDSFSVLYNKKFYEIEKLGQSILGYISFDGKDFEKEGEGDGPIELQLIRTNFIASPLDLTFKEINGTLIKEYTISGNIFELLPENSNLLYKISEIPQYYSFNTLDPVYNNNSTTVILPGGTKEYKVAKIQYGETAGYHTTDLVYNTDLILKAGETITSLLDKLKNMLSNFEYFYDINGRFVFQKKKDYIQELFSPIDGNIINPTMTISPYEYKFEDTKLFTAISNSPKIDNVKNDFVVWGSKKSGSNDIPFHARCAIHEKPQIYTTQPYYEKRKLTYLQREYYSSGKPFIYCEESDKEYYKIDYNEVFSETPQNTVELEYNSLNDVYEAVLPFIIPKGKYIMKITPENSLEDLSNFKLYGIKESTTTNLNLINTFSVVDNKTLSDYIYTHEKNYNKLQLDFISDNSKEGYTFTISWYPLVKKYNLIETDDYEKSFDGNLYYLKDQCYWLNGEDLVNEEKESIITQKQGNSGIIYLDDISPVKCNIKCTSKNLLSNNIFNINSWESAKNYGFNQGLLYFLNLTEGQNYTISFKTDETKEMGYLYMYHSKDNWLNHERVGSPAWQPTNNTPFNFTIEAGYKYALWWFQEDENKFKNFINYYQDNLQIEKGKVEAYTPFATAAIVRGKNWLNDNLRTVLSSGNIYFGVTDSADYFNLPAGTYTFSVQVLESVKVPNVYVYTKTWDDDLSNINKTPYEAAFGSNQVTFELEKNDQIKVKIYSGDLASDQDVLSAQIELGNKATNYETYVEPITYTRNADGIIETIIPPYSPTTLLISQPKDAVLNIEYYNNNLTSFDKNYYKRHEEKTYRTNNSIYSKNKKDIVTEWQEIIYQMALDYYRHNMEADFLNKLEENNTYESISLYPNGKTGYEQYYQDLQAFWRLLYNPEAAAANYCSLTYKYYPEDSDYKYWNKYIHSDPSKLPYWLEFLDLGGAELSKYSISEIGQRPKVINENNINSIYYKEIPEVQFVISPEEVIDTDTSYTPLQIQKNMEALFSRSSQGLSAIEKINELLYQHSCCSENLNLTSIPIWYLQPNTRIYVEGQGDYTLDKIQYNLNHNGTMNLTCTKVIKQIF